MICLAVEVVRKGQLVLKGRYLQGKVGQVKALGLHHREGGLELLSVGGNNRNLVKAGIDFAELHPIKSVAVISCEVREWALAVPSQSWLVLVEDHILIKLLQVAKLIEIGS